MKNFFLQNLLYENMNLKYQLSLFEKEIKDLKNKNNEMNAEILKKNKMIIILMERYDVSPNSPFLQN
jgi:hypothetical protein